MTTLSHDVQIAALQVEAADAIGALKNNVVALQTSDDPDERFQLARNTQEWIDYTNSLLAQSAAVASASVETLAELKEQRDSALDALQTLTEAVEYADTDHPLVEQLVEELESNTLEWAYNDAEQAAYEEVSTEVCDDITGSLRARLNLSWQQASALFDTLRSGGDAIDAGTLDALIAYLQTCRAEVAPDAAR